MSDRRVQILQLADEIRRLTGEVQRLSSDVVRLQENAARLGVDLHEVSSGAGVLADAVEALRETHAAVRDDRRRRGELVFVVDRDERVHQLAYETLEPAGFEVRSFLAGEHVVDELGRDVPRATLIDLALPGMPGATLAEYIRMNPRTAHVCRLGMTAFVPGGRETRAFTALIEKPMTGDGLRGFVHRSLERWQTRLGRSAAR